MNLNLTGENSNIMGSIEIGAKIKMQNYSLLLVLLVCLLLLLFFNITKSLDMSQIVTGFPFKLRVFVFFYNFQTLKNNLGRKWPQNMEDRKHKRTPNENSADNFNTELIVFRGKRGGSSKMLWVLTSCLYPPQNLAYCFA